MKMIHFGSKSFSQLNFQLSSNNDKHLKPSQKLANYNKRKIQGKIYYLRFSIHIGETNCNIGPVLHIFHTYLELYLR